jgi:coiled-coil domain-containing protein 12
MEDAAARRERLKALKQAQQLIEANDADAAAAQEGQQAEKPVLKFRNYVPKDEKIDHEKVRHKQPRAAAVARKLLKC